MVCRIAGIVFRIIVLSLPLPQLFAQVTPWPGANLAQLTHARHLTADMLGEAAPAENYFSALGVTFSGVGMSIPRGGTVSTGPYGILTIVNQPLTGGSEAKPLIIHFSRPAYKVAFRPGRDPAGKIELTALNDAGQSLGSVSYSEVGSPSMPGHISGAETTNPAGISTIIISYGDLTEPETIDTLWWVSSSSEAFLVCVPQIAVGRFGSFAVENELQIQNLMRQSNHVTVKILDKDGRPMAVTVDGDSEWSTLELILAARTSSAHVLTGQPGSAGRIGYAWVESEYPVSASVLFRTFDDSRRLVTEVGFHASPSRFSHLVPVERDMNRQLEIGIAVANHGHSDQPVVITLLKPDGFPLAEKLYSFKAGEQRALFLAEAFDGLPSTFKGSLQIASGQGTAAIAIRTIGGIASSSLNMGSLEP